MSLQHKVRRGFFDPPTSVDEEELQQAAENEVNIPRDLHSKFLAEFAKGVDWSIWKSYPSIIDPADILSEIADNLWEGVMVMRDGRIVFSEDA